MTIPIISVALTREPDTVAARSRARQVAGLLHFEPQDRTRIAAAVSEISRNAFTYAGGGKVDFLLEQNSGQALVIRISDRGPGIANLDLVLSGRYRSSTGMGVGICGARRLMDDFEIQSVKGSGTTVVLRKFLPASAPFVDMRSLESLSAELTRERYSFYDEVQQQNQELLAAFEALQQRQDELSHLNQELEETNRGVVALYAELEEKAEHLRRANQMKSRFLSHMSHELRTPLNAIVGLTRLLLKRGEIASSAEATKQIVYIQSSAEDLTQMVNDLLDLAKAEAGKLTVNETDFEVTSLFGALRALMRPLLNQDSVELEFEEASLPSLRTDEAKVSQILRNLISNAIKFTERGKVSVSAQYRRANDTMAFSVKDTGIGIAPEDQGRIFEEFSQVDSPTQRRVKGTGLGLPLCKKLAEVLGGAITVESRLGAGSTFSAIIPRVYGASDQREERHGPVRKILIIDDEEVFRYLLRESIAGSHQILEADDGLEGIEQARRMQPDLIFLDLTMPIMDGFEVLNRLQADNATRHIPIVIATAQRLSDRDYDDLSSKAVAVLSKDSLAISGAVVINFGPPVVVSTGARASRA